MYLSTTFMPLYNTTKYVNYLILIIALIYLCIIIGDFNLPDIDWNFLNKNYTDANYSSFLEALTIDIGKGFPISMRSLLIHSNNLFSLQLETITITITFGPLDHTSDHCSLSFYVNCLTLPPRNASNFDYNKADQSSLALLFMDTDWLAISSSSDDSFENSLILVNRFINESIIKYITIHIEFPVWIISCFLNLP